MRNGAEGRARESVWPVHEGGGERRRAELKKVREGCGSVEVWVVGRGS